MVLQSDFRKHYRTLLCVLLVFLLGLQCRSFAQQLYMGDTYSCSNSGKTSCDAFALYRAQPNYADLNTIGALFNLNGTELLVLNKELAVNEQLTTGYPVLVPITCICFNQTSYANLSYTIQNGDTFYDINLNNYEFLSTTNAVINANPTVDYSDLEIGSSIVFPARCACPSLAQIGNAVTSLVTYPVVSGDDTSQIAASFGVPLESIITANELGGGNAEINIETTVLVPIETKYPTYTEVEAAPVPAPSTTPVAAPASTSHHSSSNTGLYVGVAVGASAGILLFTALGICFFLALKRRKSRKTDTEAPLDLQRSLDAENVPSPRPGPRRALSNSLTKRVVAADPLSGMSDLVSSDKPSLFTYEELCQATNNFSDSSVLHGSVYRGILKGQMVAIKQMKGEVSQELRILCRVHHRNLIKLVGLCVKEAEHLYLIYEYAENGSLSDCLHTEFLAEKKLSTESSSFLSWTMRVQIALDAATGLEYIHDYVSPSYVHKDVKSSNILLDKTFRAKISNFAMAKAGGPGSTDMMTRHIAGTYGYMAPEYIQHGLVSTKADVFAFGVVLLELLSGDQAISAGAEDDEKCLYSVIRPILESPDPAASLKRWMDPVLSDNYPLETAMSMAKLAKSCVDSDPALRPSMKDVAFALANCANSSAEWETSAVFESTLADAPVEAR